jgi:flagellar basal body-associated protein FliL
MADDKKDMAQGQEPEATEAAPAKKKGKLPIIVMLAVMLAGGGFFGMKMRQPKEHKKPEIKLGAVLPLKEFLVNLTDGGKYLRAEIVLHLKDGAKIEAGGEGEEGGGGGPDMDIIRDAVITVLTSKCSTDVQTPSAKDKLRREIASAVNGALEEYEKSKGEKPGEEAKASEEKEKPEDPKTRKHPDWASETGPVLKVYFTSFATQ